MNTLESLVLKLVIDKLERDGGAVSVFPDEAGGGSYICVTQNNKFKFHIPCESTEASLSESLEIAEEIIQREGYILRRIN